MGDNNSPSQAGCLLSDIQLFVPGTGSLAVQRWLLILTDNRASTSVARLPAASGKFLRGDTLSSLTVVPINGRLAFLGVTVNPSAFGVTLTL